MTPGGGSVLPALPSLPTSGTRYFVEVDGGATVREGHDIGGRVRSALRTSPLRIADAFIHIEPAGAAGDHGPAGSAPSTHGPASF